MRFRLRSGLVVPILSLALAALGEANRLAGAFGPRGDRGKTRLLPWVTRAVAAARELVVASAANPPITMRPRQRRKETNAHPPPMPARCLPAERGCLKRVP